MLNNQRSRPFRAFDPDVEAPRIRYDQQLAGSDDANTRLQGLTKNVREVGRLVDELETLHTGQLDCVTEDDKQRHNEAVQAHTRKIHDKVTAARNELKQQEHLLDAHVRNDKDVSQATSLRNSIQMLGKALGDAVRKLQKFDSRCKTEQKQAVQEQLHAILGHEPKDIEVDRVLASGDRQAVLAGLMTNRNAGALQSVLTQMEGRLTGVEALAREVEEIVHVMQGMARMVKDQESKIDTTRKAVDNTAFEMDAGMKQMSEAGRLKGMANKYKAWICSVLLITIIAIVAIVLLVTLGMPK